MKKVILAFIIIFASSYTHAQVTKGLVAMYSFDNGNANDEAGTHNGTVNGATLTTDRFGCPDKAYSFNGANANNIRVVNHAGIDFNNGSSFTVAFWTKFSAANGSSCPIIKQIPGSWNGYLFLCSTKDAGYCNGKGKFSFYTASGASQDACADSLFSNDTTRWLFVTGVYNGTLKKSYLYVNAKLQSDVGTASGSISTTADLYFGNRPSNPYATPFSGKLDDIRIYNRALNQNEIDTLFHLQPHSSPVNAGPDASICFGLSTTLNGSGGNPSNYAWSPSAGLSNTHIANPVANPTVTTKYVLTSAGSCTSGSDTVVVSVVRVLLHPRTDTTICGGLTLDLNPNGSAAYTYTWSPSSYLSCTGCINPVAMPVKSVTYLVVAKLEGCENVAHVVIDIGGHDKAGTISTPHDTLCEGSVAQLTLSGNSSNTIQWQSRIKQANYTGTGVINTVHYSSNPLTETTDYRVIVGEGSCADTSSPLKIYVPPVLTAYFNFTTSGREVTFNADSSQGNIAYYSWVFGDGTTSNGKNPKHTYQEDSTYNACLTIYDGSNCSYTYCRDIKVTAKTGISGVSLNSLGIYPNPFGNEFLITGANPHTMLSIELYDVPGRLLQKINTAGLQNAVRINGSQFTPGMYFIKIETTGGTWFSKVVKK